MEKGARKRGDADYGVGECTLEFDEEMLLDEEAMKARILETFSSPQYHPPTLPSVAMDLLALSRVAEVEFNAVVSLLEQDSMIAGDVLRISQSPIYAGASQVASLADALMRLGLATLRDLVVEVTMNMRVFRTPCYVESMERVRSHSSATAHLSRIVAKHTPIEGEYSFLGGLLHDIGIAGILIALGEGAKGKAAPDLQVLWPAIHGAHQEAASLMAKQWNLPQDIQWAIGAHHQVLIQGYAHPLASIICVAEDLTSEYGYGLVPEQDEETEANLEHLATHQQTDRSSPKTLQTAREALQLTDNAMHLIRRDIETAIASGALPKL